MEATRQKAACQEVTRQGETGAVSLYVAIVFAVFMLMVGLVADGAEIRSSRRQLDDTASRIARQAAVEVSESDWHVDSSKAKLDAPRAVATATSLIAQLGLTGEAVATETAVEVTLRQSLTPALSVIPTVEISATRKASPISKDSTSDP